MKRSTTAKLILMGSSPLLLAACDHGPKVAQEHFTTVQDCERAGVPASTCESAHDQAMAAAAKDAPHYSQIAQCEDVYGAGQCQPYANNGNSYWVPFMTGFLISRMISSGPYVYFPGGPLYHMRGGGFFSPYSVIYGGGYRSAGSGWHSVSSGDVGSAAGSHAITASRGGFGSSFAARGGWGS